MNQGAPLMTMFASAVASQNDHGYEAGRYVAAHALAAFQSPPTLFVASIGVQHNQAEVVRGICSIAGIPPLVGCSADGVITSAGVGQKEVALLAIRANQQQISLVLATKLRDQPVQAAEQAVEQVRYSLLDPQETPESDQAMLLMLAGGSESRTALTSAVQTAHALVGDRCTVVGIAAASGERTPNASVFVNEQVTDDGLAVVLLRSSIPLGVGLSSFAPPEATATTDAAQEVARQASATLGTAISPAAAFVVMSGLPPSPVSEGTPSELANLRAILGHTTPLVGMYGPGVVVPQPGAGVSSAALWHQQAALVCTLGKGSTPAR